MENQIATQIISADLKELGTLLRSCGKTVVWTNGCFDLIHVGHIRSLRAARSFGDILVVGVNSDASVRRLKGSGRPVIPAQDRVAMLQAIRHVDFVVEFDEDTPENCLRLLQPDIHCKGAEYAPPLGKVIPEAALVESFGGKVVFLPMSHGLSTSELIRRVRFIPDGD